MASHEDAVAHAALLILQTIAASDADNAAQGFRILPSPEVLSHTAAAEYLSRMQKPLACESVVANSVIELRCGNPEQIPRWSSWAKANLDAGPSIGPREQEEVERTGNRQFLLVGNTASIILSDAQVEQLGRDYIIIGSYTVTSFVASRLEEPPDDVAVVQRYWRSTPSTRVLPAD